jgi:tRNA(Ile)-lysidine synthase
MRCGVSAETGTARLLVALSGGTDSTALLLGMHELLADNELKLQLEVAHFNHSLRGEESDKDEQFCRDLCTELSVPLHVGNGDVRELVSANGVSVEAAARELRYQFFRSTVETQKLDAVVTAHTMDDQAETVLLAMTRGAGLRGVSGMSHVTERGDLTVNPNKSPLKVIRPLLQLRRSDTENYCIDRNVTPREDESNSDVAYARNRIRHRVFPELQQINPGVVEALSRLADIAETDIELIDELAERALLESALDGHGALSKSALAALSPALRSHVMRSAFARATGSTVDLDALSVTRAVEAALKRSTGSVDLPNGARLLVDHDSITVVGSEGEAGCPYPRSILETPFSQSLEFAGGGRLAVSRVSPVPDLRSLNRWQAAVGSAALAEPLVVRSRLNGDRFHPLGMPGEMKLQDFLVNQHLPARWRDRVPLIVGSRGIAWVVGERIAEWAKVPDGATDALMIEYVPPEA